MNLARAKALGLGMPLTIQKTADDPIGARFAAIQFVRFWHLADMAITFSDVCFWG
jgi:hypothetical protein